MTRTKLLCLVMATFFPFYIALAEQGKYHGKKILYVNSYHKGYEWGDGEQSGAEKTLTGTGVELRVMYMDTKNNPADDFCQEAGRKVKKCIDEFRPDVLIVADDNAFAYVVIPYYKDAPLPVVFCGINWDISRFQGPFKNTTGMLEVALIKQIYGHLKKYAKGGRVGFLGFDVLPERLNAGYYEQFLGGQKLQMEFVKDFDSWKHSFLALQEKCDIILFGTPDGIKDWDKEKAREFIERNIKIPIGSDMAELKDIDLISLVKIPQEQGEYAAYTALRILDGEKPCNIPVVMNKKGDMRLNLKLAGKLHIIFAPSLLKNATEITGIEN